MNPIDELVKESEAMLHHLNDDSFDPSFAGRTHRRREALSAAIPAAQLYAERMGEVVEAAEDVITTLMTDNECKCLNRLHKALASLDSAEVGESAGGWIPCAERLPSTSDWYLTTYAVDEQIVWYGVVFFDGSAWLSEESISHWAVLPPLPAPPTATAKETNDDES